MKLCVIGLGLIHSKDQEDGVCQKLWGGNQPGDAKEAPACMPTDRLLEEGRERIWLL